MVMGVLCRRVRVAREELRVLVQAVAPAAGDRRCELRSRAPRIKCVAAVVSWPWWEGMSCQR